MRCADLLVKLYMLDNNWAFLDEQKLKGIVIRKPLGGEIFRVVEWVRQAFGPGWASEVTVSLHSPVRCCFIAIREEQIIGFCCYDSTALGFCGPLGVDPLHRSHGTGSALLKACLLDMKLKGYGYAVMGWVAESTFGFYEKAVNATVIDGSHPGVYAGYLKG